MESYPPRHRSQPGSFSREEVSSNYEAVISASPFTVTRNVQRRRNWRRSHLAGPMAFSTINTNLTLLSTITKGPDSISLQYFIHCTVTSLSLAPTFWTCTFFFFFFLGFLISSLDFSHNYIISDQHNHHDNWSKINTGSFLITWAQIFYQGVGGGK